MEVGSIDLGNIIAIGVAVGALIVSTISFVFTYRRNRVSEQIKIVSDIFLDKISNDYRKLHEFDPKNRYPSNASDEEQWKFIKEFTRYLGWILDNIIYLSYLKENREIENRTLVDFLTPRLLKILRYMNGAYAFVETTKQREIMSSTWAGYLAEVSRLIKEWEREEHAIAHRNI
jgi:hypothetical protein